MIPLLFFITAFVFILGQYGATDLAMELVLRLNEGDFDKELYDSLREQLDLDKPVYEQFYNFIINAFQGDFGRSYILPGTPEISDILFSSLGISVKLGLAALLIIVLVAVPLGILAAYYRGKLFDYLIVSTTSTLSSIPPFALAPIFLVLLVSYSGLIGKTGFGWHGFFSKEIILPAITLAAGPMIIVVRIMRSSMIEVLSEDYITAAKARGISTLLIVYRHVLKNSITPVVTVLGLIAGHLLSGSIFIETVFGINGFGYVAVTAFQGGDVKTVAATTLVSAILIMVMNLFVDLIYGILDPRVRIEK